MGHDSNNSISKVNQGVSDSIKQPTPTTIEGSKEPIQQSHHGCQIPKLNNPFMNLNVFDIPKNPPKTCDSYDNPQVQDKIGPYLIQD